MDEELIERLYCWSRGEAAPPYVIEAHITNLCNLACRFCWLQLADKVDARHELSEHRFIELVEESAALGVREWRIIGGGEPLVKKRLVSSMISRIKQLGMSGNLTTSGVLLDDEFMKLLFDCGWDVLTISLDSAVPETNDYLRGKEGAFELVDERLRRLRALRESHKNELELRFHPVLCYHNYHEASELIRYASERGVSKVLFQPVTIYDSSMAQFSLSRISNDELLDALNKADDIAGELGIFTNLEGLMADIGLLTKTDLMDKVLKSSINEAEDNRFLRLPCLEPWYLVLIRPDGLVTPCNRFDYDGEDGKLLKIEDIWYGEFFNKVRRQLYEGNLLPVCATCCAGGVIVNRRLMEMLKRRCSGHPGSSPENQAKQMPSKGLIALMKKIFHF